MPVLFFPNLKTNQEIREGVEAKYCFYFWWRWLDKRHYISNQRGLPGLLPKNTQTSGMPPTWRRLRTTWQRDRTATYPAAWNEGGGCLQNKIESPPRSVSWLILSSSEDEWVRGRENEQERHSLGNTAGQTHVPLHWPFKAWPLQMEISLRAIVKI